MCRSVSLRRWSDASGAATWSASRALSSCPLTSWASLRKPTPASHSSPGSEPMLPAGGPEAHIRVVRQPAQELPCVLRTARLQPSRRLHRQVGGSGCLPADGGRVREEGGVSVWGYQLGSVSR